MTTTQPPSPDAVDDVATYASFLAARRALAQDVKRDPATMARGLDRTYRMRPHVRVIGETMRQLLAGEIPPRVLILTPPQVGKSTTVAEWTPFWWFTHRPTDDIVIASYGADLAIDRSKGIRDRIVKYGADYGLHMQPGSRAMHDWELTSGGHLLAVGVGGGLTGRPANLMVIDDPHKDRAEAESPRVRGAVHDWWSSTGSSRLQPDMGAVVVVMTRWHEDDFAGRRIKDEGTVHEGGKWTVIHLPAFADPKFAEKFGPDPIGRSPGEPLTHPKIKTSDTAALVRWWQDKKTSMLVRDWHALCQGDPQPPSGALVTAQLLMDIRARPGEAAPAQRIGVAIDPSGGGRDTAGIIGGYLGDDKRLWITHDRSGVMASAAWSVEACLLAHETEAAFFVIETNYGGDMATLAVRNAWATLLGSGRIPGTAFCPLVKVVKAKQGKLLRAEPIAQQMIQDRVRFLGRFPDLESEWITWQPTDQSSPGRIDASVYLAYALLPIPSTGARISTPEGRLPVSSGSPLGGSPGGPFAGAPGRSGLGPLG